MLVDQVNNGDMVTIRAYPTPFKHNALIAHAPAGMSLADIIGDAHDRTFIVLDGEFISRDRWSLVTPRADQSIMIHALPGGGGDDVWRSIAQIGVVIASFYIPGAFGLTAGIWQFAAVATTANVLGNLAVNALLPPVLPALNRIKEAQGLASISGIRNQMLPYGTVPRPYGMMKLYPIILGKPFSETIGNDQYVRVLFAVGIGDFELSDLKIGDTSIDQFNDILINAGSVTVDSNYGGRVTSDPPIDLYSRDVDEAAFTEVITDDTGGTSATRTTSIDTTEIGVEMIMPQGIGSIYSQGDRAPRGLIFNIEISLTGQNDWSDAADQPGLTLSSKSLRTITTPSGERFMIFGKTSDSLRLGISFLVDEDQYDVKVTGEEYVWTENQIERIDGHYNVIPAADLNVATYGDLTPDVGWTPTDGGESVRAVDMSWTALRSWHSYAPVSDDMLAAATLISVRMRGSEQLNGTLDQFNLIATAKLSAWSGSAWGAAAATRNPAWAYVDALTGSQSPRPVDRDTRINADAIKSWADDCAANGYYYDSRGDDAPTTQELIHEICAAGRASYAIHDGLYTVVRDIGSQTPVQMFTPRNARGLQATKVFSDIPHAFRVRFINPDKNYEDDEITVYDDGYTSANATQFQTIQFPGVNNYQQCWKFARYRLAELRLRPEVYTLAVDIEHLACRRGDSVQVAHDVTEWGSGWGRVKTITIDGGGDVTQFTTDAPVAMDGVSNYIVRVRLALDGSQITEGIQTSSGYTSTIVLDNPVTGIDEGDLFVIGLVSLETVELKVQRITMEENLNATLRLVDAAPAILDADSGTIPAFNSNITVPLDLSRITPPVPVIYNALSDEKVMVQDTDGSYRVRMLVFYRFDVQVGLPALQIEARIRSADLVNPYVMVGPVAAGTGTLDIFNVNDGEEYIISLRARNGSLISDWSQDYLHVVIGKSTPPPDVTNFKYQRQPDGTRQMSWDYDTPPLDHAGFRIYYRAGTGQTIENMSLLPGAEFIPKGVRLIETNQLLAGTYTFAIVAIDTAENESVNPNYIEADVGQPRRGQSLSFIDYQEAGWPGTLTDCHVTEANELWADSQDTWATHSTWSAMGAWNPNPYTQIIYETDVLDIGFKAIINPQVLFTSDSDVTVEMNTSEDDVTYTGYVSTGTVYCRYIKIRITVDQTASEIPNLKTMSVNIAGDTIEEDLPDIDCSALSATYRDSTGVIRLPITKDYIQFLQFNFSYQDTTPGWEAILVDKTSSDAFNIGPQFKFYKNGSLADPLIDAYIKGVPS